MFLLDVPRDPAPMIGAAGLVILVIVVLILAVIGVVGFVLLLKLFQRRRAADAARPQGTP